MLPENLRRSEATKFRWFIAEPGTTLFTKSIFKVTAGRRNCTVRNRALRILLRTDVDRPRHGGLEEAGDPAVVGEVLLADARPVNLEHHGIIAAWSNAVRSEQQRAGAAQPPPLQLHLLHVRIVAVFVLPLDAGHDVEQRLVIGIARPGLRSTRQAQKLMDTSSDDIKALPVHARHMGVACHADPSRREGVGVAAGSSMVSQISSISKEENFSAVTPMNWISFNWCGSEGSA